MEFGNTTEEVQICPEQTGEELQICPGQTGEEV